VLSPADGVVMVAGKPQPGVAPEGDRTVVFRQIVGVLARRIVTRTGPGQRLATGERMGLMKFGSRMDVFVPPECTVTVTKGQRVRGGETVIARWPAAG
jgi:phosphatidylserine decarboxylase